MVTTRGSRLSAWTTATGALTAAMFIVGPMAPTATAAPPPPTPAIGGATVHFSKDHSYIALQTTPCSGCKLEVAARYGAHAAYPTGLHGSGVQKLFVLHGTRIVTVRDLTTYKLSIWQRKSGADSATPAHLSIKVGEDLFQLQSKVFTQPRGPHSLELDYNLLGDGITQDLTKLSAYAAVGHTPPGSPHKALQGTPGWTCTVPHCPHHFDATAVIKGLQTHRHYAVSLYGFDAHGNVGRGTAQGFVQGIGSYINTHELLSGLTASSGSLAVDRAGGQHELASSFRDDPGNNLTYVTRRPGAQSFSKQLVHGAGTFDAMFLASSVSGRAIDVVLANCHTLYTVSVSASADRLPTITPSDKAVGQHRCSNGGDGEDANPDLEAAVGLAHGRLALLFDNDPAHPRTDSHQTVWFGKPGHRFTKTVLPASVTKIPGGVMARDPSSGTVYVANKADDKIDVWRSSPTHATWSQPVSAATVSPDDSDALTSMAAADGQLWVSVFRAADGNDGFSRRPSATDGVYITHRNVAGHWTSLARMPHSTRFAQTGLLAASPTGGSVWELDSLVNGRAGRSASGLERRQLRIGHGWSRPTRLSRWFYDDPTSLVATWQDSAVYSHQLF